MALAGDPRRTKPELHLDAIAANERTNDMICDKGLLEKLVNHGKRAAISALIVVPLAFGFAGCQPNVKGDAPASADSEEGGGGGDSGGY